MGIFISRQLDLLFHILHTRRARRSGQYYSYTSDVGYSHINALHKETANYLEIRIFIADLNGNNSTIFRVRARILMTTIIRHQSNMIAVFFKCPYIVICKLEVI